MKKSMKMFLFILFAVVIIALLTFVIFVYNHGNTKFYEVPQDVHTALENQCVEKPKDTVRIMSSNLLVYYKSWGGEDARPRAKMYFELRNSFKPDVIAVQELCDMWYQCFLQEKSPYKLLYPVATGVNVRFTALMYNTETTELLEQGQHVYSEGDNPRLRRVVWGLFKDKASGKEYIVTSTHFDLIRRNKEAEELATMMSQKAEMVALSNELRETYQVPVFHAGDFNCVNNVENWKELFYEETPEQIAKRDSEVMMNDAAPTVYEALLEDLQDTKLIAEEQSFAGETNAESPSYDHIFLNGDAKIKRYASISDPAMHKMSDHFSIFVDAQLN